MDVTAAAAIKPVIATRTRPVTVNGVAIGRTAIAQEAQNHPASTPAEAWTAAARALAIPELLLQEARTLGLQPVAMTDDQGRRETDEEALVRAVVEREVATPVPDADVCRRYYARNLRRFRSPDLFEVSHILLAAAPTDREARVEARRNAEALIGILIDAPEQFAALARLRSACPSRSVGGNLGQIGPGQTVPEFERALGTIAPGPVHAAPVESRYGFHVVRVARREDGRQLPFEVVQSRIADYLGECVRRTAIRQYISVLAGRAAISGVELPSSPSPLVR